MRDILDAAIMTATDLRSWVSSFKEILITILKYSIHLENFRQDFVHSRIHRLLTIISSSFNRYLLSHSHEPVYRALFGCRQYGGSKEKGSALIFWTYSPYSRWFWSLCISPTHLSSARLWRTVTSPRTCPTSGSYHSPKMWVAKWPRLPTF